MYKQFEGWGINLSIKKSFEAVVPKRFLTKITSLNLLVIILLIVISSWAIYSTACSLVDAIGSVDEQRQTTFNRHLLRYIVIVCSLTVLVGASVHYTLTKRLLKPINAMIESIKIRQRGTYSPIVKETGHGEVGELVEQYNLLITEQQVNDSERIRFISDLSHELRTPLTNLTGYLHALETGVVEGNKDIYSDLQVEAKRLLEMVEQFEQLKEWDGTQLIHHMKQEHVEMNWLINQATTVFDWKLKQEQISLSMTIEPCDVYVNIQGIEQVLHNLLDNAIRYYEGVEPIEITGKMDEDRYVIEISNPTRTLSSEHLTSMFERLYRVDYSRARSMGGSGLGLSIVKDIIEHHEQEISVSQTNTIITFSFGLPIK